MHNAVVVVAVGGDSRRRLLSIAGSKVLDILMVPQSDELFEQKNLETKRTGIGPSCG